MANMAELEAVLGDIKAHPEDHDQNTWVCGTTACFAGRTVLRHGWLPVLQSHTALVEDRHGRRSFVDTEARCILELTRHQAFKLFLDCCGVEDLEQTIKEIGNGNLK